MEFSYIEEIYKAGVVVGKSGATHPLNSHLDPREGQFIAGIIEGDLTIVRTVEVGCANGISSLWIMSATRGRLGAHHTIIDPNIDTQWDGAGELLLRHAGLNNFALLKEGSEFALPKLTQELEEQIDLVFIDGCHTFDHTLLDCFYATRLLRVGGYLILDEVGMPAIRRVVDFLSRYPCYERAGTASGKHRQSPKKRALQAVLGVLGEDRLRAILSPALYDRIFGIPASMVALKKISLDERECYWHDDRF